MIEKLWKHCGFYPSLWGSVLNVDRILIIHCWMSLIYWMCCRRGKTLYAVYWLEIIDEDIAIKLDNADFRFLHYFAKLDDGFGSGHEQRVGLVAFARRRDAQHFQVEEDVIWQICNEKDLIVIANTPRDIQCAHAHNVPVIVIAIGHYSLQCLSDSNADALLSNFQDTESVECSQFTLYYLLWPSAQVATKREAN